MWIFSFNTLNYPGEGLHLHVVNECLCLGIFSFFWRVSNAIFKFFLKFLFYSYPFFFIVASFDLGFFHFFFTRICSSYGGESLWQFHIGLYWTLLRSPPLSLYLDSLPTPLKTIVRCSLFYLVYEVHQPYSLTLISTPPYPTSTPIHTLYLFYSTVFHY
jgi:hypothetical protein